MSQSPKKSEQPPPEDLRGISRWTRTYAQNRSLGVVVFMIVFVVLAAAIGGASYLAGEAYRSGNMPLFWGSIALLLPAFVGVIYLSNPFWGGRLMERVVQRLYAGEGTVAFSVSGEGRKAWGVALAECFGVCIVASVVMGFVVDVPIKYMQPISALYVVPFLVGLWFLMRPMVGWAALLWPALYAAHAILIVAGAPIVLTVRPWDSLNILIPIAGYGLLSGLVGHLYSRMALAHLKRLTKAGSTVTDPSGERSQP